MTAQLPPAERPRNPQTEALHKHEAFWQIYFPMWLALLVVLTVCILAALSAFADGGAVGRLWADISLVFLVLQAMMFAFPLLILFGGLAYGVGYIIPKLSPYFKIAQDYVALAAREVKRYAHYVEAPVVQFKGGIAGLDQFLQSARRFFRFK